LSFYVYVLSAQDLANHDFGVRQEMGRQGPPFRFTPVGATTAEVQVGENPPHPDPDHSYTLFAEFYVGGTYYGRSCFLAYQFDPDLCNSTTDKLFYANPLIEANATPEFCPTPVNEP
jgi:hypothetical protein